LLPVREEKILARPPLSILEEEEEGKKEKRERIVMKSLDRGGADWSVVAEPQAIFRPATSKVSFSSAAWSERGRVVWFGCEGGQWPNARLLCLEQPRGTRGGVPRGV